MKLLTFTTLFPSAARPRHGIFVETRLTQLRRFTGAQVQVIAPVPWFPSTSERFGRYAAFARTPAREVRDGVPVRHPRYLTAPVVGMYTQPQALARCGAAALRAVQDEGYDFDLIDAHYLYPDGVAAAMLARRFDKPLVLTARGSDVNRLAQLALPRRRILQALEQADAIVTVSAALRDRLADLGVDPARVRVLRNGVDTSLFRGLPRPQARALLGLGSGPVFAAVGNLVPEKGHDLAIAAAAAIPGATLLLVGEGPEHERLEQRARELGARERIRFLGERPQSELPVIYSAADALILASTREGWPNVVLEAIACGTPVVAAAVGGIPEIIVEPDGGVIVRERSEAAFVKALAQLLAAPPARDALTRYAARFGWQDTANGLAALCAGVLAARDASSTGSSGVRRIGQRSGKAVPSKADSEHA